MRTVASVEELPPALPEDALGDALALADVCPAGDRLVVVEARRGKVHDAKAGLPGTQTPVDVLVGHRIGLVEQPDALDQLARHIHACSGHRQHRAGHRRGAPIPRLEAVAVVEPLRRPEVARRAGELDAPVGVEQPRADDANVLLLGGRVLQARQPAGARLDVGVQDDHVPLGTGDAQPAIDVRGEAHVLGPLDDLDARDRSQRLEMLRTTAVVGDDHPRHPPRHSVGDAVHQRPNALGVAEARDHDVNGLPALAIPGKGPAVGVVAPARAQLQVAFQGREAQREGEHPEQERAPA